MRKTLTRTLWGARKVVSARWTASDLHVPTWALNAIIYITLARACSYGVELLFVGNGTAFLPLAAYTAVWSVQVWGVLILLGVAVLLVGLLLHNTIVITVGVLLCTAVWVSFAFTITFGALMVGTGLRFAIAAPATAATWAVFFCLQLKAIRREGAGPQ